MIEHLDLFFFVSGYQDLEKLSHTRITRIMIDENFRQIWDFIFTHKAKHKVYPDVRTVREITGLNLDIKAPEPFSFWEEHIFNRFMYESVHKEMLDLAELMSQRKTFELVERMHSFSSNLKASTSEDAVSFKPLFSMTDLYDYVKRKEHETPITTPFPSLTERIGGGWRGGELIVIAARMGQGKCLRAGTKILMFNGTNKAVEDLVVGDLLMGPDSKPRTVLSLCKGKEEMFKVIPTKGDPFVVNRSHILSMKCSGDYLKQYKHGEIVNMSIDNYLKQKQKLQNQLLLWRTAVDFPKSEVEFDPYLIGLWLGDGTKGTPNISNPDKEIIKYLYKIAPEIGLECHDISSINKCPMHSLVNPKGPRNPLLTLFKSMVVNGEKRVPHNYLVNDRESRLQLLAGLLDSDGYLFQGGYEIVTKWEGLRDDILFLARSLGFAAYTKKKIGTIKSLGFSGEYWRINISGDCSVIPLKIERKKAPPRLQKKSVLVTGFKLESEGEGDYYGFTLDGDHLFLLSDFTVTHNTYALLHFLFQPLIEGKRVLLASTEMSDESMMLRSIALKTQTSYKKLRNNQVTNMDLHQIQEALGDLADSDRALIMKNEGTIHTTLESIDYSIFKNKPDIVGIDGAYLLHSSKAKAKDRFNRIAEIFDMIKGLAKKHNVPIIVTSQINRAPMGTKGQKMDLSRLAFSDNIGMIADWVFFLNKDPENEKIMIIQPAKMREADNWNDIRVNWNFEESNFTEEGSSPNANKNPSDKIFEKTYVKSEPAPKKRNSYFDDLGGEAPDDEVSF